MSDGNPWDAAAPGWAQRQEQMRQLSAPLSQWLVEAIAPQPGHTVLELAAGIGDTGYLAAEMVLPGGRLICTDNSEAMLQAARARAEELSVPNVEHKQMNAEWIDLPVASVDAVICRWGYMLMADPAAALRESRRVLRAGGHLALAVWDEIAVNPWAAIPAALIAERELAPPPQSGSPGPFALGDSAALRQLLEQAGFQEIMIEQLELTMRSESFEDFWQSRLDLSAGFHDAVMSQPAQEIEQIRSELAERLEPFTEPGGAVALPACTLAARAGA